MGLATAGAVIGKTIAETGQHAGLDSGTMIALTVIGGGILLIAVIYIIIKKR